MRTRRNTFRGYAACLSGALTHSPARTDVPGDRMLVWASVRECSQSAIPDRSGWRPGGLVCSWWGSACAVGEVKGGFECRCPPLERAWLVDECSQSAGELGPLCRRVCTFDCVPDA